jgi:hypothetical protein
VQKRQNKEAVHALPDTVAVFNWVDFASFFQRQLQGQLRFFREKRRNIRLLFTP